MQKFHSPGKLLITGEYVVLDGAIALALPTKYGQTLIADPIEDTVISWKSIDQKGETWFEKDFSIEDLLNDTQEETASLNKIENRLKSILKAAMRANPSVITKNKGFKVTTKTDFPLDWGLGTSSTLIANMAKWFKINPYNLLEKTFGGSGYDVAVAMDGHPITYELTRDNRSILSISFDPVFKNDLFFVYLNQKQDSRDSISYYKKQDKATLSTAVEKISSITHQLITCDSLTEFNLLLEIHENIISKLVNLPKVKTRLFPDFSGAVKSLGGWGGDFILATGGEKEREYFRSRGYNTIIPYPEMIA